MRVLVCGGRDYKNREELYQTLDGLHTDFGIDCIIEGAAQGADALAGQWADENKVQHLAFPAQWEVHGKTAGPIRNRQMLVEGKPDLVVAFKGGKGTQDMRMQAQGAGVKVLNVALTGPYRAADGLF